MIEVISGFGNARRVRQIGNLTGWTPSEFVIEAKSQQLTRFILCDILSSDRLILNRP